MQSPGRRPHEAVRDVNSPASARAATISVDTSAAQAAPASLPPAYELRLATAVRRGASKQFHIENRRVPRARKERVNLLRSVPFCSLHAPPRCAPGAERQDAAPPASFAALYAQAVRSRYAQFSRPAHTDTLILINLGCSAKNYLQQREHIEHAVQRFVRAHSSLAADVADTSCKCHGTIMVNRGAVFHPISLLLKHAALCEKLATMHFVSLFSKLDKLQFDEASNCYKIKDAAGAELPLISTAIVEFADARLAARVNFSSNYAFAPDCAFLSIADPNGLLFWIHNLSVQNFGNVQQRAARCSEVAWAPYVDTSFFCGQHETRAAEERDGVEVNIRAFAGADLSSNRCVLACEHSPLAPLLLADAQPATSLPYFRVPKYIINKLGMPQSNALLQVVLLHGCGAAPDTLALTPAFIGARASILSLRAAQPLSGADTRLQPETASP